MNKETIHKFKECKSKEELSNIIIHKIVFFCLFTIIIILIIFIIIFQIQITNISNLNLNFDTQIQNFKSLNTKLISKTDHVSLSLYTRIISVNIFLSNILFNKNEFNLIMNWIPFKIKPPIYFSFQLSTNENGFDYFVEHCLTYKMIILFKTSEGKRFGTFVNKRIFQYKKGEFIDDIESFLFSIDNQEIYRINTTNGTNAYIIYEEDPNTTNNEEIGTINVNRRIIGFGDKDLIIYEDKNKKWKGYSKFPSSFINLNNSTYNNIEAFTGTEVFDLEEMEVITILSIF